MEKKDMLGVRKKTAPSAVKRRRKVVAPTKAGGGRGAGAGRLAKAIADYLAFDSYMYAPLVADPTPPPAPQSPPQAAAPPAAAPPCAPPEALGKLPSLPARSVDVLEFVDLKFTAVVSSLCYVSASLD
ncbi:hypothetical protein EJB05_48862 [Eragrostis curvula]|uniref:Uncharacterized protein n=1 Tax=Eragrostis curvula TaxID=38414 RepID=A0A5J9T3W2_9POAL|nr:hypothetical protein EJB05_48862 [Eragrostis curvula]